MKKIGITGSLASGKTTASKILSYKKGPLFSADKIVRNLYSIKKFKKIVSREFGIKNYSNIKKIIKQKIVSNSKNIIKLEKIIHPLVRREMYKFLKKNKRKKFTFLEIPLLIESKLMKNFDVIFFIKAKRRIRMQRFKLKGGDQKIFNLLNKKQLSDKKKIKYCDHVVVNDKNLKMLKKNLLDIFKKYE